ncbi:MAG: rhomboid family intramembrane serine protease [Planctomycetaceae bacterium]|nr:rhomboid family intramembrane serine protease [Planctomycetaceae bacterium]
MLLPINTDAPIYYFPWMTISLIVANIAAFAAAVGASLNSYESGLPNPVLDWILVFGDGLHPMQWISSAFLHGDIFHLLGNMFFLWGFGLVVEGKLGWWKYLAIYLGIAAVSGLIEQVMMLGYTGSSPGALGASGVIFGLMAMSLLWAPKNDMTLFLLLLYQPYVFEASILAFCGCFLALQILLFALDGFSMGSALLYLIGAIVGGSVGLVMLKRNLVDCEGWDIFAVMNNTYGRSEFDEYRYRDAAFQAGKIATPTLEPETNRGERIIAGALDPRVRIRKFLDAGDSISALGEYEKLIAFHPMTRLDRDTLAGLAEGAFRDKSWDEAEPLMRQYLERFSEEDAGTALRIRLKLAKILIDQTKRPAEGLTLLREIDPALLPPKPAAAYQELRKRAQSAARSKVAKGK